jgi:agmatinase
MKLDYLPPAGTFLDPHRVGVDTPETAKCVVIPFGLEASVSYGGGTGAGPRAILEASQQLELFDDELWREPYLDYGIAAIREPKIARTVPQALDQLAALTGAVVAAGKFPFVIGGEHSLTPGAIRPLVAKYPDLAILQIDAHADLRDGYLGEHYSHASAMRRVLDNPGVTLVSVGIRALCQEEADFADANRRRIHMHLGRDQARYDLAAITAPLKGRPLYITFDIDGLDSALIPATGTPVPGGLSYLQALAILRAACETTHVVGADLVELAPMSGFHAANFTAAQLAYKMMNYALAGTRQKAPNPVISV